MGRAGRGRGGDTRLSLTLSLHCGQSLARLLACRRRSITFGNDTAHDIVAAASADALVVAHGAGCTNWFFMQPGSALLEIRRAVAQGGGAAGLAERTRARRAGRHAFGRSADVWPAAHAPVALCRAGPSSLAPRAGPTATSLPWGPPAGTSCTGMG